MTEKLKVFLCHASENKPVVKELFERLKIDGFNPWLDSEHILPGMDWDLEIQKAMNASDIVIICLSSISVLKEGYVQKEIKYAQEIQKEKPEGTIFLIPVQLEACDIPTRLQEIQWGKYYELKGYNRINESLRVRANQLGKTVAKGLSHTLPVGSYIPFPRNALFTGRDQDLEMLRAFLTTPDETNMTTLVSQTISGMGGIGKTQLAVEFAYQYGYLFKGVHWLDIRDTNLLDSQIALCGEKMNFRYWPKGEAEQVSLTFKTWQTDGPRLIILDNFESISDASIVLARFQNPNLRLIITSRHSDWPTTLGLQRLPLDVFTVEEGKNFLKKYTKERFTDLELNKISERLGELPLALELAGRYLEQHPRLLVDEYLNNITDALDHPSMRGFRIDLPNPTGHDLDLLATFALSWQQIQDETAKKVFLVAGYCAPNIAIPFELFEKSLSIDPILSDAAISLLTGLGLIKENVSIHPLLADYAQHLDQDNTYLVLLVNGLKSINEKHNQTIRPLETYKSFLPFISHIKLIAENAESANVQNSATLWSFLGFCLRELADYPGAKDAYERALKINEAVFGFEHPDVAKAVNNLGMVLHDLGDLQEAKSAYERALKIYEAIFASEHPEVAKTVNNLGIVLRDLGDLQGAKSAYERALKIAESVFGSEHPDVARVVNNLGVILRDLGDLQGAKSAYERALKIDESVFGSEHPEVAKTGNNLGVILRDLGDLQEAKSAYERALKINEAVFGSEHPEVAKAVNNLGAILLDLGDLQGAKSAYERALKIDESVFGSEHPDVARTVNNLGSVLHDLGDLQGAKSAHERALKINEAVFGSEHPEVARAVNNLGIVLRDLGDLQGARVAFKRALPIFQKTYGSTYETGELLNNLGLAMIELGNTSGINYLRQAQIIIQKLLPHNHPLRKKIEKNIQIANVLVRNPKMFSGKVKR